MTVTRNLADPIAAHGTSMVRNFRMSGGTAPGHADSLLRGVEACRPVPKTELS